MNKTKDMDLGKEAIGKLFFMLAVPAIASQVVNALYNIVDRMYIGHISEVGSIALTGVGVCFPIIMIVSAFAALVSMGGAPRASIMMGKGKHEEAEKILGNCFQALIITSLILTVVILTCKTPLLMLFGASDNTLPYAESYMLIYAIGTVFVQLTLGMNAFISAQGFSRISMLTVVIGAVTNIMLDPILIFLFDLGVQGAALATVLSQAVSAVWVIRFLIGKQTIIRLRRKCFKIEKAVLLPAMALGIAPFIMQSTESLLILCFNSSLLQYGGDVAVGTMTILSSVMQFAMMPLIGFTQGSQPIISYNYGAGNIQRIRQGFRLLLISCLTYATLLWFLVMLFPQLFAAVFTSDPELMEMTIWGLRVYMFGSLLMGAQLACQQTFIALGNAKTSAFLAMFRKLIVLIPLIYILPSFFVRYLLCNFIEFPAYC